MIVAVCVGPHADPICTVVHMFLFFLFKKVYNHTKSFC